MRSICLRIPGTSYQRSGSSRRGYQLERVLGRWWRCHWFPWAGRRDSVTVFARHAFLFDSVIDGRPKNAATGPTLHAVDTLVSGMQQIQDFSSKALGYDGALFYRGYAVDRAEAMAVRPIAANQGRKLYRCTGEAVSDGLLEETRFVVCLTRTL